MIVMPTINADILPENEQESARFISRSLEALANSTTEFVSAVELYGFSLQHSQGFAIDLSIHNRRKWPLFSARIGAMCLYNFWQGTQNINKQLLPYCPTVQAGIDKAAKKNAQKLLRDSFPKLETIRHTAAHSAETNATPQRMNKNTLKNYSGLIPGFSQNIQAGNVLISESIVNREYINTIDGEIVSYMLNKKSADDLISILGLWRDSFENVSK